MSKSGVWKNRSDGRTVRRHTIPPNQQWTWWTIEMLESPAYRALKLSERRVIDRIRIEFAHHDGQDNGKLPVTSRNFHEYGIRWDSIAPAIRASQALGFIRVTRWGVASNAEFRIPNLFALTHLETDNGQTAATNDWNKIKTLEEADAIARAARKAPARNRKFPKKERPAKTDLRSRNGISLDPETGSQASDFEIPKRDHYLIPETGSLSISRGGGGGSGGESILKPAENEHAGPDGAPPAGIGHNNGPPLAPDDSLTIPTFLLRGHADCVLGSSSEE
jgi:hypothetical protein